MKKNLKISPYLMWFLIAVCAINTPLVLVAVDQKKQELSAEKKRLASRLIAEYKETWQLYKKRKAGKASPEELKKLEERMKSIKKTAHKAGVIAAVTAALVGIGMLIAKPARKALHENKFENAIRDGNYDIVESHLNAGRDPNEMIYQFQESDRSPLWIAVYYNKVKIANLLITRGARIYDDVARALLLGGSSAGREMMRLLLSKGANPTIVLRAAVGRNFPEIVSEAIRKGANVNEKEAVGLWGGTTTMLEIVLEKQRMVGSLAGQRQEMVLSLLKAGASYGGHERRILDVIGPIVVPLLLEKGANKELLLFWAAEKNNKGLVLQLLEEGARADVRNSAGRLPEDLATNDSIKDILREKRTGEWQTRSGH